MAWQSRRPLHICRTCWVEHAENCPKCLGFGFARDDGRIIRAGEAKDGTWPPESYVRCKVCKGSPVGRP